MFGGRAGFRAIPAANILWSGLDYLLGSDTEIREPAGGWGDGTAT